MEFVDQSGFIRAGENESEADVGADWYFFFMNDWIGRLITSYDFTIGVFGR